MQRYEKSVNHQPQNTTNLYQAPHKDRSPTTYKIVPQRPRKKALLVLTHFPNVDSG